MGPTIAATVFGAVGVIAAYLLRPRFVDMGIALRAAAFWLLTTPLMFALPSEITILIACSLLVAVLRPARAKDQAPFYIAALLAVPNAIRAALPFPGLNYLVVLTFAKIAAIIVLLPALVASPRPLAAKYAPAAGALVIVMTVVFSLLDFRVNNLTSGLRAAFDTFLFYALPFMALVRVLRTRESIERVFAMLVFIAMIFFFAGLISQGTKWNFYTYITNRFGYSEFADFRYGFLRVSATVNTVLAGYIMILGLLAVEYFRGVRSLGFVQGWMLRGMCVTTAFFTFSRGAWLGMIAAYATFLLFARMPRSSRPALIALGLIVGAPIAVIASSSGDFDSFDDFGTFGYRQELLRTSIAYIAMHPLFGDPLFRESGFFDHLYQGQGIIDVVNTYVNIALRYGLTGLTLFVGAFAAAVMGLLKLGEIVRRTNDRALELQRAVMLAAIAGYMTTIFTTSSTNVFVQIFTLVLALSVALTAAARAEATSSPDDGESPHAAPERDAVDTQGDLNG